MEIKIKKKGISLRESVIFAMLGAIMLASKIAMEALPNLHLVGMLVMVYTLVYRKKALVPIYIFVMLFGLIYGFSVWWIPYLYIWALLWGVTMLLPRRMPRAVACVVYPVVCSFHGFAFGILYAPAQALFFGLNFEETLVWIASGAVFDVVHGFGNLAAGLLVLPMSILLQRLEDKSRSKKSVI